MNYLMRALIMSWLASWLAGGCVAGLSAAQMPAAVKGVISNKVISCYAGPQVQIMRLSTSVCVPFPSSP